MIKSMPTIVQSNQIDALVIDSVTYYVELAAIQLGIPYIHVDAGMHFDYSGHTPIMCYGWPHETNAAALSRNWRHNTLNTNELYEKRLYHLRVEVPNASSLHKSQGRRYL
jgi:hypothetical protein